MAKQIKDPKLRLIELAIKEFPKVLKRQKAASKHSKKIASIFDRVSKQILKEVKKSEAESKSGNKKVHPWRVCPAGSHWVVTHPMRVSPSKRNPEGGITIRSGHCAQNPSGKDVLTAAEMEEIASKHFDSVKVRPNLFKHKEWNRFDSLIAGWTQYWNDVFQPKVLLDPNIIKALIASESSFDLSPLPQNAGRAGMAKGLIQITDQAQAILKNPKGELKDHLIDLEDENLNQANPSIAAGTRWLFHKKDLASNRLRREATWEEAVAEYKGYLKDIVLKKQTKTKGLDRFRERLSELEHK